MRGMPAGRKGGNGASQQGHTAVRAWPNSLVLRDSLMPLLGRPLRLPQWLTRSAACALLQVLLLLRRSGVLSQVGEANIWDNMADAVENARVSLV